MAPHESKQPGWSRKPWLFIQRKLASIKRIVHKGLCGRGTQHINCEYTRPPPPGGFRDLTIQGGRHARWHAKRKQLLPDVVKESILSTLHEAVSDQRKPFSRLSNASSTNCHPAPLQFLPLEIQQLIYLECDLVTLLMIRGTNRQAYRSVEDLLEFRVVKQFATHALKAALGTAIGHCLTFRDLYDALCTIACDSCRERTGVWFSLLSCQRLCFTCCFSTKRRAVIEYRHVKLLYGLDSAAMKTLPCLKAIPGNYNTTIPDGPPVGAEVPRPILVDRRAALHAAIRLHDSEAAMMAVRKRNFADEYRRKMKIYNRQMAAHRRNRDLHPRPQTVNREAPYDDGPVKAFQYMAVLRLPFYDPRTKNAEWGFRCWGCESDEEATGAVKMTYYTEASFKKHVEEIGQVVDFRHIRPGKYGTAL